MAYKPLDAREWLESQRLAGCEFAEELLDLWDGQGEREEMASALEDIHSKAPYLVNGSKLELHEYSRIAEWVCDRLDLLDSLESIIDERLSDMTYPNGKVPVDPDDKLRAAFESDRWLTYDL